ncbi:invasion protein, partial [Campylobacter helveticus]
MQSLLSNFKPKQAEILLSAIKNANDEEFSSFVLNNINAIKA